MLVVVLLRIARASSIGRLNEALGVTRYLIVLLVSHDKASHEGEYDNDLASGSQKLSLKSTIKGKHPSY